MAAQVMAALDERVATLLSIAEKCVGKDELLPLLQDKPSPVCFDGVKPSGRVHIAQGVGKVINVSKMIRTGRKVKILVEDQKTGGDLNKIRTVGRYMIETWKALGMNLDGVVLWSSEEINKRPYEYWLLVMDIVQKNERNMQTHLDCSYASWFGRRRAEMSKRDASPAIFMEDNEAELKSKIKQAFCPPNIIEGNLCLEYIEHIGGNSGALHPGDLKPALTKAINQILQPVRDHFKKNGEAKVLLNTVKKYLATKSAEGSPQENTAEAQSTEEQPR